MTVSERRTFKINGRSIGYTLKRSNKARLARLEVGSESGLTVVVPAGYLEQKVQLLLTSKRRWIADKLGKYGYIESGRGEHRVQAGDSIPFLGRNIRIETKENAESAGNVCLGTEGIVVNVKPGHAQINVALEKWYREEAHRKITGMVEDLSARMGLTYNRVTLKGHRSIWGSCSKAHNLNFNWRLVMTPETIIEYFLVHELAHLREMNHSARFWTIVEKYCPDWRARRKWLRDHARELAHTIAA